MSEPNDLDPRLARRLGQFCQETDLTQQRAMAAAKLLFMGLDAGAREQAALALDRFLRRKPSPRRSLAKV